MALHTRSILEELGCKIIAVAPDVPSAISAIKGDSTIDCATLDVRLGDDIASSVAGALIAKEIPFVVCSGYNIHLRHAPQIPVVHKPFTRAKLEEGLLRALGLPAS